MVDQRPLQDRVALIAGNNSYLALAVANESVAAGAKVALSTVLEKGDPAVASIPGCV